MSQPATLTDKPKFSDLRFGYDPNHEAAKCWFPNGYGVSVVRSKYTYGGAKGLYELAVLHNGAIAYDTPITDDVLGWLTPSRVTELMRDVAALPARGA